MDAKKGHKLYVFLLPRPKHQRIMSMTKIPFILLATWGFNTTLTPPNPPPPANERIDSRVPMESPKFTQWVSFGCRVSDLWENI